LSASTSAGLAAAASNREALEKEVAKSGELIGKIHQALFSMTSLIIEKLGDHAN